MDTTPAVTSAAPPAVQADSPARPVRGRRLAALDAPYFRRLWLSGLLWNMTRWMGVFLGSYLVNQLTGSPLLVQLVGGAFFAPMFFGGMLAGTISDRFDRRNTILRQLAMLTPVAIAMGLLVMSGHVQVWMVYPVMLLIGIGGVVDMTSRRALIYDVAGEERITNALALESMSMSAGSMSGAVIAGAIISLAGVGEVFLLMALCYAGSFALLFSMPSPPTARKDTQSAGFISELRSGLLYVRADTVLVSILGITVLMNLFYFPFMPMVPVFAERLEVNPFLTGLLASGMGMGMMLGAIVLALRPAPRRGLVYCLGSFVAVACLAAFAVSGWYPLALAMLICAGLGAGGFGTMQGVLVMVSASPEMRGRAMGVLSMAIGGLPFGMVALGLVAQALGPAAAVVASVAVGVPAMALWLARRPEALRIR